MKAIMQGFVNKEKRFGFYRVQREAIPQDAFDRGIILPLGKDCGRQKWKQSLSFFFFFSKLVLENLVTANEGSG